MEKLYERMTSLLGEPYEGAAFRNFVTEMGMEPSVLSVGSELDVSFPELGVSFRTKSGSFSAIEFHICTPTTLRQFKPYDRELAAGITPNDKSEMVKQKLRMAPTKSRRRPGHSKTEWDFVDLYDLENFRVSFSFDGETGAMYFASVYARTNRNTET